MNGSTYLAWESGISKGDEGRSSESDSLLLSEVSTCWKRGYSSRLSGRGAGTSITATQQERGGGRGRKGSPLKPRLSWPYQYCCSHTLVDPNYHIVLKSYSIPSICLPFFYLHPLHLYSLHLSTPPPHPRTWLGLDHSLLLLFTPVPQPEYLAPPL